MRKCLISVIAALVLPSAAFATTVTFDVVVTQSFLGTPSGPSAPTGQLPALGTLGTMTISLPGIDATNTIPIGVPDIPPNAGIVQASVTVGSLSASLDPNLGSVSNFSDTIILFANGSLANLDVSFPRDPVATPSYAGSFRLQTPLDGFTPSTFGDVAAALADPTVTAFFSFNGTTFDGIDTSFRVDTVTLSPIPLPAGGAALLTGLGLLAWFRRRQA